MSSASCDASRGEVEAEPDRREPDGSLAVDAERAAEVEVAFGVDAPRDVELHRGGDRAERDAGAGDERLEQHVSGAGERAGAAGGGVEAGFDERAAGLDLARDLLGVELSVGAQRDEGGRGLLAIAVLERRLHRLQLGPVHAPILESADESAVAGRSIQRRPYPRRAKGAPR